MIEEISAGLYRVDIPLPGNPLRGLNSYVIKGRDRNLIIDTGWDRRECREAMLSALQEIGVDLSETDFFITHVHADHIGLLASLLTPNSRIFFNKPEADIIKAQQGWGYMFELAGLMGFPEEELKAVMRNHPVFRYYGNVKLDYTLLKEGDALPVDGYDFRCIETPGHTRGHLCLYEEKSKLLISGDHILAEITPNIQLWSQGINPLQDYLDSLDKVSRLDIELVLPGHRRTIDDCRRRIGELKEHYRHRADEVLRILSEGTKDAYEVAGRMTWDLDCATWEGFPAPQKWFATGEAIAHLKYLEERQEVVRAKRDGIVVFSLN